MNFFNPTILSAAKDAGISIAVLIGVLAVFGVAIPLIAKYDGPRRWIVGFSVVIVSCLLFIFWVANQEVYEWIDTKAYADWAGNDEGWTDGDKPNLKYCDRGREGSIVTCWRNRPSGYPTNPPPVFKGTTGVGPWCTYKIQGNINFGHADGGAQGRVYICGRVSL